MGSIGGYTNREYNITGSVEADGDEHMSILSYGNGPGFRNLMTDGKGNFTQINRTDVTLDINASAELKFRQVCCNIICSSDRSSLCYDYWSWTEFSLSSTI